MNRIINHIDSIAAQIEISSSTTTPAAGNTEVSNLTVIDPFPVECLPGAMRRMAEEISKLERTPAGIAGCCTLGIASAALGKGLKIKSHNGKVASGNLYIIVLAPPSSNKSETFRPIAAPLLEFEMEQIQIWEATKKPGLTSEQKITASKIKRIENQFSAQKEPENPDQLRAELVRLNRNVEELKKASYPPRLTAENATSEALQILLSQNDECISSISPDAREVMDVLAGRYRSGGGTDEGIFLKGYSLEPYISDRVTRVNVTIKETWLSVLWLVQPDKLAEIIAKHNLTDSGLLQRFLFYSADFLPAPIDRNIREISAVVREDWNQLIRNLLTEYRLTKSAKILTPATAAIALLDEHYNQILYRRANDLKLLGGFAGRWNEQAWRLCVVLHAGLHGVNAHEQEVSENTAHNAIRICDWFARQQLAILGWSAERAEAELQNQVLALASSKGDEGIVAADVYHKRITPDAQSARALLTKMAEAGQLHVQRVPRPGGGWIHERYFQA